MRDFCEQPGLSRRRVLAGSGALFAWAHMPRLAFAADGRDPRLVVIILRGALDGLAAVGPVGDPNYARLHGDLALAATGSHGGLPLDSFFVLHPAMSHFARYFRAGQAAIIHAVATNYRDRSHFDGQDVLESGLPGVGSLASGWLNRALQALPQGEKIARARALGIGVATPLILRGAAPVLGWAPQGVPGAADDLTARVLDLYQHRDKTLFSALSRGIDTDRLAQRGGLTAEAAKPRGGPNSIPGMRQAAEGAARLMASDEGPRIAALAFDGWDTHANEGGPTGRLAQLLSGLDGAFAAFETGLGARWKNTAIVAVTEFGRTARINGTIGTDHGTGTMAFLAGGAIRGGRVIADWPGLSEADLYQNRDLKPTTDLRSVFKGLLADQFGLSAKVLGDRIFPDSAGVRPMQGLIGA